MNNWKDYYHLREWAWLTACEWVDEWLLLEEAWLNYIKKAHTNETYQNISNEKNLLY